MGRKRNPYIQLFTRDILSSPRCRALSESAAGVYLFLLCRLNEPPTPGAYRISDWELHPNWKRSCTQQCLATADKQARLQYFAKMLSKNDLPWKTATILGGLQELYKYGIITVEGDMLIQPRMFKDNGFELPDIDNDGDPVGTILDDPASGSMALRGDDEFNENKGANNGAVSGTQNGTEKVQKKVRVSHAPAPDSIMRVEIMRNNNNNINNKGNIGGLGDQAPNANQMQKPCKNEKTGNNNPGHKNKPSKREKIGGGTTASPDAQKPASSHENGHRDNFEGTVPTIDGRPIVDIEDEGPIFSEFWEAYDKRVNIDGARAVWDVLSVAEHEAIMAYIPQYKRAQPNKKFRYNPVTFLTNRAWKDELIQENEPINNKGYEGSKNNQRGSASSPRCNQRQDNDDMRDQTVRIVQRLRANRQADKSDEPDPGGGEG